MSADIDIDLADRDQLLELIQVIPARQTNQGLVRRHNSGVYATDIPWDPVNACSAIDYETAEQLGYFKIDLLNMTVYQLIRDAEHYNQLLDQEPDWNRLCTDSKWASQLVHIGNYTELLKSMRPDSIPRMAAFISIIRPGKAHLQNQPWVKVFESVWDGNDSRGFVFKKSHALGYSKLVTLHMNLLSQSVEPM
jgi:DNA polymerase III alpha subunit